MAHHGLVRATNDVDVLIATDETNGARIRAATLEFVGVEPNESALRPPRGMFRIGPPAAHVDANQDRRHWGLRSRVGASLEGGVLRGPRWVPLHRGHASNEARGRTAEGCRRRRVARGRS